MFGVASSTNMPGNLANHYNSQTGNKKSLSEGLVVLGKPTYPRLVTTRELHKQDLVLLAILGLSYGQYASFCKMDKEQFGRHPGLQRGICVGAPRRPQSNNPPIHIGRFASPLFRGKIRKFHVPSIDIRARLDPKPTPAPTRSGNIFSRAMVVLLGTFASDLQNYKEIEIHP